MSTKIKITFDDSQVREYTLKEEINKAVNDGCRVSFIFCHPEYGEIAIAKKEDKI